MFSVFFFFLFWLCLNMNVIIKDLEVHVLWRIRIELLQYSFFNSRQWLFTPTPIHKRVLMTSMKQQQDRLCVCFFSLKHCNFYQKFPEHYTSRKKCKLSKILDPIIQYIQLKSASVIQSHFLFYPLSPQKNCLILHPKCF